MAAPAGRRTLTALFKQGWDEIPEVVGSFGYFFVGTGLCTYGLWNYYRKDGDNRRYKSTYVVYRDTDPRAALVRKD